MDAQNQEWTDILITDRDITLDTAGIPEMVVDRPSITQDIVHMILESGILIELIGERSQSKWADNMNRLETLVEDDNRIIPGTVQIDWTNRKMIYLYAKSLVREIEVAMAVGGSV